MSQPYGSLTAAQMEIMEIVWERSKAGATVAEIWQSLSARRSVARTTVLTMVNRLEQRGWLLRRTGPNGLHYLAGRNKDQAAVQIAGRFIDEMFGGSATALVKCLLGSHRVSADEVQRLREMLDQSKKEPSHE